MYFQKRTFFCWTLCLSLCLSCGCADQHDVARSEVKSTLPGTKTDEQSKEATDNPTAIQTTAATNQNTENSVELDDSKPKELPYPTALPTLSEVTTCLNLANLKPSMPGEHLFQSRGSLSYSTKAELEVVAQEVQKQLADCGLKTLTTNDLSMQTLTFMKDNRPATIMISSSENPNESIVQLNFWGDIDLSALENLPGSFGVSQTRSSTRYAVPMSVEAATAALKKRLTKLEWPLARTSSTKGTMTQLAKDGLRFTSSVSRMENVELENASDSSTESTNVYITSGPHLDLKALPMLETFERLSRSTFTNQMETFKAHGKPREITKKLTSDLNSRGWTPVRAIRPGIKESQSLLIQNGCFVEIQASAINDGQSEVQLYTSMLPFDIPAHLNAKSIRVDTAAPHLSFSTKKSDIHGLTDFYVRHLQATGWTLQQGQTTNLKNVSHRVFNGTHYQPVLLEIQSKDANETWVELRPEDKTEIAAILFNAKRKSDPSTASQDSEVASTKPESSATQVPDFDSVNAAEQQIANQIKNAIEMAASELEGAGADNDEAKAMLAELKAQANALSAAAGTGDPTDLINSIFEDPAAPNNDISDAIQNEESTDKSDTTIDETHGVIAENFPVPETAKEVKRQADIESISYYTHKIRPEAEFFAKELKKLGFRARGESDIDDDFGVMQFQKGNGTVRISFIKDERNKIPVRVMILGDGLLWPGNEDEFGIETGEFIAEGSDDFNDDDSFSEPDESFTPTEHDGIRLPKNMSSVATSGTPFLTLIEGTKESPLKPLVAFFQDAMTTADWKKDEKRSSVDASKATLVFKQGESTATFVLEQFGDEVDMKITKRNVKEAKAAGMLPPTGKCRIVLANAATEEATITINKKAYKVPAGLGAENPAEGKKIDLPPGTYDYTVKVGSEEQKDKIKVEKGGAWGIIAFPGGQFSDRVY